MTNLTLSSRFDAELLVLVADVLVLAADAVGVSARDDESAMEIRMVVGVADWVMAMTKSGMVAATSCAD